MSAERDQVAAYSIAALLKVELEPWQEFVLTAMLREYRRPDPPEVEVRLPDTPEEECGARAPMAPQLRCLLPNHDGDHSAGSYTWE